MEIDLPNVPRETNERLLSYAKLIAEWNLHINLTGAKSLHDLIQEHIVDCSQAHGIIFLEKFWLDVGTGAGLPGIVWAILDPDKKIILVESVKKKAAFLHHAKASLKLNNVEIFSGRFEAMGAGQLEFFGGHPFQCVSRGTTDPHSLLNMISKSKLPWDSWVVFSSEITHQKFVDLSTKFDLKVEKFYYEKRPGIPNLQGILTKLKKMTILYY